MLVPTLVPGRHHCVQIVSWTFKHCGSPVNSLPALLSTSPAVTHQLHDKTAMGDCAKSLPRVSFSTLRHISHLPMNLCMSKYAEQSLNFSSSAVDTASLPQEKLEGSSAFKAERKLMNPPKCYAGFHNEYVSILFEQSYLKMCFYI